MVITTPSNNDTVYRSDTIVIGTVSNATGSETGVVVNGMLANIYGDTFVANHVPLVEGANTITATATDAKGNTATATMNMTSVKVANYIKITANSEVGLSPLEIVLTLDSSLPLTNGSLTYTGPGEVELLSSSSNQYRVRMTTEGIYHYIATLTDAGGTVYEDTIAVIVMPKTDLEALLQNKWNEVKAALLAGNLDLALTYFVPAAQDRYNRLLGGFTPNKTNSVFSNIIGLELNTLLGNVAECAALRQESDGIYAYTVTFVLDQDGVWRIIGF